MQGSVSEIRNSVKAICRNEDGELLMLRKKAGSGNEVYTLPGGLQEQGETLVEALLRVCENEIGCRPILGPLFYVCEYNEGWLESIVSSDCHLVEFGFLCAVSSYNIPVSNDAHWRKEIVWVDPKNFENLRFEPKNLASCLVFDGRPKGYCGLV